MCRLPQEAMMDVLLINNQISPEMVTSVAQKLMEFHQKAETNANISAFGDLDTITQNTEENFTQTEKYIGSTIRREKYRHIKDYTDSFIRKNASLFYKRIAYVDGSQDKELAKLLDFYKCYRAYVRGKVESFKLDDPHISAEEKARALAAAKSYFELAESYVWCLGMGQNKED